MHHLSNSTTLIACSLPTTTARGQIRPSRQPSPQHEPAWQPDDKPSSGPCGNGNGWRAIDTRRDRLSRPEIVTRIRTRIDPSLLPAPAQPGDSPVSHPLDSLRRTVLHGVRSLIASMPALHIGPAGANAAQLPANSADRPAGDRISYFIKRFGKAFDIRKAPTLAGNADLGGATVVVAGGKADLSDDAMRVLTHLRREHGDRILIEGLQQASRWHGPACDRFDGALRESCSPIEAGCAASARFYEAMHACHLAIHDACAFVRGNLSVLRPDITLELPGNVDECLDFIARYADLVAPAQPASMQRHALQVGQAVSRFKAAGKETTAPRQAHMLAQLRQPVAPGATRFVVMNADFLADLAPQLLALDKVILLMPREMAHSDARYRMPHPVHRSGRDEL